jgi:hypothetical protein
VKKFRRLRPELIFEVEDEIRRHERELAVRRWEHQQILKLLENNATAQRQNTSTLFRLRYRLQRLIVRLAAMFTKR